MGICYGHQILAHLFGGTIQPLQDAVMRPQYPLSIIKELPDSGIFTGFETLEVFAVHRDYMNTVPDSIQTLSQKYGLPYIIYTSQRDFYGFQFVPELSDPKAKEALIRFLYLNPRDGE